MIFKVEVLRAWENGTWDTDWITVDENTEDEIYQYIQYDTPDAVVAEQIVAAWVENLAPEGLVHAAPIFYEEEYEDHLDHFAHLAPLFSDDPDWHEQELWGREDSELNPPANG